MPCESLPAARDRRQCRGVGSPAAAAHAAFRARFSSCLGGDFSALAWIFVAPITRLIQSLWGVAVEVERP